MSCHDNEGVMLVLCNHKYAWKENNSMFIFISIKGI